MSVSGGRHADIAASLNALLENVEQRTDKSGMLGLTRREDFELALVQPDSLARWALVDGHVVALSGYQRRAITRTFIAIRRDQRGTLSVGAGPKFLSEIGVDTGKILFFVAAGFGFGSHGAVCEGGGELRLFKSTGARAVVGVWPVRFTCLPSPARDRRPAEHPGIHS